ncbi:uncharacterized protein LOC110632739 [Hevea brasiliensis]|uniref:uncharacterized protein LOC110632739 n=1 Tax=Hevea brasiliensis TaxID=3981 RepID=UPI0025F708C9|nr:uncharacterized protein LOC110632739 [Hevea brasiliensis]
MERPLEFDDIEVQGSDENEEEEECMQEISSEKRKQIINVSGTAFNAVNYDSFGEMIRAIVNYERKMKPPSFHETAALLASLIEKELMEIGPEKVVQVVRDNASNNVAAGRILEANFPHLYWTPCAADCIDLILEDIFKIRVFKETFYKVVELISFIYGSSGVLNMLRKFTNGVSGPLIRVLRLVDNEKKPAMGYIYEAMDRAKEAIANSFNGNEEKYKRKFEIVDARWSLQLYRPLHAIGYFLNP